MASAWEMETHKYPHRKAKYLVNQEVMHKLLIGSSTLGFYLRETQVHTYKERCIIMSTVLFLKRNNRSKVLIRTDYKNVVYSQNGTL